MNRMFAQRRRNLMKSVSLSPIMLRSNYFPNGRKWCDNAIIYFTDGDYVEATVDISNCRYKRETIFAFGQNIDSFPDTAGARYYVFYTQDSRELNTYVAYRNAAGTYSSSFANLPSQPSNSSIVTIRVDRYGLWVNGSLVEFLYENSNDRTWAYISAISDLCTSGLPVEIGSKYLKFNGTYGETRSFALYDTIALYRGAGAPAAFAVTESISYAGIQGGPRSISRGRHVLCELVADDGYEVEYVTADMGGIDISNHYVNGALDYPFMFGNISITGTTIAENSRQKATVTLSGSNVIFSNISNSEYIGDAYNCRVEAAERYYLHSVTVTMGGTDITASAYADGLVSIASVSGNIVISAVTEHETVLRSSYTPNGSKWTDTTVINFASGDYVEASLDLTTCTGSKENILSVGQNIDSYSTKDGSRFMVYYTRSSGEFRMTGIQYTDNGDGTLSGGATRGTATVQTDTALIRVDRTGLYINGQMLYDSTSGMFPKARSGLDVNGFVCQIGSAEGSSRSHAGYSYIKVVREM